MRQLLALLDGESHGTSAEPEWVHGRVPEIGAHYQSATFGGTWGTRGTPAIEYAGADDVIVQRVADLADSWHERMAICSEAGDISEVDVETAAALEVGRALARHFVQDDEGRGWLTGAFRPKSQGLAADVIDEGDVARQQQE